MVDWSANTTDSFKQISGVALNAAVGLGYTVIVLVIDSVQPAVEVNV
jgi:hypothetical protein